MGFRLQSGLEVKEAILAGPAGKEDSKWRLILGPTGNRYSPYVRPRIVDHVVVRFGIDPETVPGPTLIQFSKRYAGHRTTLNRVELPFVTMSG